MFPPPSITDVRNALKPLVSIPRPDGDNEGDPINSETVLPYLSAKQQDEVNHAEEVVKEYTRTIDHKVNQRALTTMYKNGYPTSLGPYQYDPFRLIGSVSIGGWDLDISDPRGPEEDD